MPVATKHDTTPPSKPRFSAVLNPPAAEPDAARQYFASRLAFETDVADLMADLGKNQEAIAVIDTRSPRSFAECHIPGAINLPKIDADTTAQLDRNKVYVTYCWGPACNGATRGAMKLCDLGFRAKELLGGMEYWRKERGPVEGTLGDKAQIYWSMGS